MCCCPNHDRLARKIPTISETGWVAALPPPPRAARTHMETVRFLNPGQTLDPLFPPI